MPIRQVVAGLGGSVLFRTPAINCSSSNRIWFSFNIFKYHTDCWIDRFKLKYYPNNNTVADNIDEIYLGKIGLTDTIEDVAETPLTDEPGRYFYELVAYLQSAGFKKNETIFGIPHDWRKSVVDTSDEYYKEVIDVILDAVTKNNGTKANLVCHSYGCINMAATIIKMGAELTQNNVNGIISLAAPWAGSMKALKTFISGDTFDIRPIWAGRTNLFQKTFTSLVHLFPSTKVWDNYTEIFSYNSSISKVSFTSWKMKEILEKSLRQYNMLQGRNNVTDYFDEMLNLTPNITKYCLYGSDVNTTTALHYQEVIDDDHLKVDWGLVGDGTVTDNSLRYCVNKPKVEDKQYYKRAHLQLAKDKEVHEFIVSKSVGSPP